MQDAKHAREPSPESTEPTADQKDSSALAVPAMSPLASAKSLSDLAEMCFLAYTSINQALLVAIQGDVDQTRRLVESARKAIESMPSTSGLPLQEALQTYISNLLGMAEALEPLATATEASMFLEFRSAYDNQKQAQKILERAEKAFGEDVADSEYWREMCLYLNKYVQVQASQFASEEALYKGDLGACARNLRKAAKLYNDLKDYVPTAAFEKFWGAEGVELSAIVNALNESVRDQLPRQSRLLDRKSNAIEKRGLVTTPGWGARLAFFALWLCSIAAIAGIAKWSGMALTGSSLFWWSALSAALSAGILEVKEWLKIIKIRGFDSAAKK